MIASILDTDEFRSQVCVVTGAARGIGAALTHSLASRGGHVVIVDVNLEGDRACADPHVGGGWNACSWFYPARDL